MTTPRAGGTDAAVELLYAAHWRRLVRLAYLLVHDQLLAEDVVQDAFVAVHGRWSRLQQPDLAVAYLHRSVVNGSRSALRHRAVEVRKAPVVAVPARYDDGLDAAMTRDVVLDALRELPRRQREVVVLRYYLDLSEADIAAALGISRGAVKSHSSRGLAALRSTLRPALGPAWEESA